MNKIKIIVTPNLKLPNLEVSSRIIEDSEYNTLLVNIYEEIEPQVKALSDGKITFKDFIDKISKVKFMIYPIGSWLYPIEPIIRSLEGIKRKRRIEVYCYKNLEYEKRLHEITTEISILIAKSKIFGKINVKEWKKKLMDRILLKDEALKIEANRIHVKANGVSLCISNLSGYKLSEILSKMGDEVEIEEVMDEYYPTPLEELEMKIKDGRISDKEIEEDVKRHVEYIEKYVLTSENIDQAYYRWLYDNYPQIRSKIDLNELNFLNKFKK